MLLVREGHTAKVRTYMKPDLQEVSHQPLVCSILLLCTRSFAIW